MVLEIFITSPPKDSVSQQGPASGGVDSHRGMYAIPQIELYRAKNVRANAGGLTTANAIKVHKIKGSSLQRSNNRGYKAVGDEISKNISVHIDDKTFRREQFFARKTKYKVFKSRESATDDCDDQLRQNSAILQSHIDDALRVASKRRMIDISKRRSSLERTRKQLLQHSGQTANKAAACLGQSYQKSILSTPPSATQCVNWAIERVESQTVAELEADVLLNDIESERTHRKHLHGRDGSRAVDDDLDIDVVKRLDTKLLQMNKKYQQQAQAASTMTASSAFRKSFLKPTVPAHHGMAIHGPFAYDSNGSCTTVGVIVDNKKKARLMVNEELRTLKTRKTLFEKTLRLTVNEFHVAGSGGPVPASDSASSTSTPLEGSHNRARSFKPSRPQGELSSGSRELSRLGSISTDRTDQLSISSQSTTSSVSTARARSYRSSHLSHRSLYQVGEKSLSDDSFVLGQRDDSSIGVSVAAGMGSSSEDFNEDEASDAFDSMQSMSMSMSMSDEFDRYTVQRQKAEKKEASRKSTVYISSAVKDTVNKISSDPTSRVSKKQRDKHNTVTSLVTIAQRTRKSIDKDVSLLRLISQKTSEKSTQATSRLLETMRRSVDCKEELLRQAVSALKEKRFDRPDAMRQRFLQLCALDREQTQLLDRRVSSDVFLRAYSPRKQPMDSLSMAGDMVREVNNTFVTQPSQCDLVSSRGTVDDDGLLRSDLHLLHAYDYHLTKRIARNDTQTKAYCKSVLQSTKWFLHLVQHIKKYHDNRRPDLKASSHTSSSHSGLIPISLLKLISIVKQLLLLGIEFTKEIVWFLIIKIINREDFKSNLVYVTIQHLCDQVQLTSNELFDYLVALNVEIAPKLSDRVRKNRQINERIKVKHIVHKLQQQGSSNRGNTTMIYFDSLFSNPSTISRHDTAAAAAAAAVTDMAEEEQANEEVMAVTNRAPLYL